jgi:TonB family protein
LSAVAHAAVLLTPIPPAGHSAAASDVDAVPVEVEPTAAPVQTEALPPSRDTIFPNHTHPYPVSPSHDATPHDPNLVHPTVPAAAAPADTTPDETPSFTIVVGPAGGDSFGRASAAGTPAPHVDAPAPLPEQLVDTRARLVHGRAPSYPPSARADAIEGDVGLELVVREAGDVESARVVRSAGHGFDEAALQAVREFRFSPAVKDGHAVRVRMGWSMQFRLQ